MQRTLRQGERIRDAVVKTIPAEVVAVYMTIAGLLEPGIVMPQLRPAGPDITVIVAWVVFAIVLVMTPIYLKRVHGVSGLRQAVVSTGSFAVWAYWLGGPFEFQGWHHPTLASIALVLWTFITPVFVIPKTETADVGVR